MTKGWRRVTIMYGTPLTLMGPELRVGDKAPEFTVRDQNGQPFGLSDTSKKIRVVSVIPSLDLPMCDAQTRRLNLELLQWGSQIEIITISCDLPFTQRRWSEAARINRMKVVSDYFDHSFSKAYGTLIKKLRFASRAIFIIDAQDFIRYVEYVTEVGEYPDYDKALLALKSLFGPFVKAR
jgi:thioredoxin-dependent peroxiredoxin